MFILLSFNCFRENLNEGNAAELNNNKVIKSTYCYIFM